jgi:hypothetical protein
MRPKKEKRRKRRKNKVWQQQHSTSRSLSAANQLSTLGTRDLDHNLPAGLLSH